MAKLHLITYGCQMNEYDSDRVAGLLGKQQYDLTDHPDEADLILINTCAIREKAEEKVFSKLGQLRGLKQKNPSLIVGVMGCMAQLQQGTILERAPMVDLVFGSPAMARVGELVERVRRERRPVLDTGEGPLTKMTSTLPRPDRLKAFVTVMEGCDKYCAFCVVPYTRGRERSHSLESILEEIRGLAAQGYREVTLLGQNVNAYGKDLTPPTDLAALIEMVNEVAGIERIRFTTSNPVNLTGRLIRAIRDVPKACEYLHLPLQSGSDRVLTRMNRGYTRARYLELIAELKETVPGIALSTDLIVGFPAESEEDFEATLEMVERVGYDSLFAFRYSPRPRTPAAEFPDQVPEADKARRLSRLLEVANAVGAGKNAALLGREMEILVDGVSKKDPEELSGRTRCNRVVNFDGRGRRLYGELVHVRITQAMPHSLRGTLVSAEVSALAS